MSSDLVTAALWLDMPPARKLVFIALCERADLKTGKCWPGLEEISLRSSLSQRSVIPHIKGLEDDQWLRSGGRPNRKGVTTRRWVNVRRVLTEGEARREAFLSERDGASEDASYANWELPPQLKLDAPAPEAASRGTVKQPSDQPSQEPSSAGGPDVGMGSETVFAEHLKRTLAVDVLSELRESDLEVVDNVVVLHKLPPLSDGARRSIKRAAETAGFNGVQFAS